MKRQERMLQGNSGEAAHFTHLEERGKRAKGHKRERSSCSVHNTVGEKKKKNNTGVRRGPKGKGGGAGRKEQRRI